LTRYKVYEVIQHIYLCLYLGHYQIHGDISLASNTTYPIAHVSFGITLLHSIQVW